MTYKKVGCSHENLRRRSPPQASLNFAKRDASAIATWFQQEAKFNQVFLFTDDSPAIAANSPIPNQEKSIETKVKDRNTQ